MKEITGIIFDISHYMIEDGPGIRTNVFLKGCPLRCKWCSNPYGLNRQPELGVVAAKCTNCGRCVQVCPTGASYRLENGKTGFEKSGCISCFRCTDECPAGARIRVGRVMSVEEVFREVERDRMFYRRGDGGMTLSGGELLMQPEFSKALLERCRRAYINTAIETSGMGKKEDLEEIIEYTDTVFMDCKMMDEEKHRIYTGVGNGQILENIRMGAKLCSQSNKRMVVRLPLIPGINDMPENVMATANFVASLAGDAELNILPYHNYGMNKYENVGRTYELESLKPHTKEQLAAVEDVLKRSGCRYSIGGYRISGEK